MADKTCSIAGCERDSTHVKRGLCEIHYKRAWRAGHIRPAVVPVRAVRSITEDARANVAEVERRRKQYAERLAGCPLELWLKRRRQIFKPNGINSGKTFSSCGCDCHDQAA